MTPSPLALSLALCYGCYAEILLCTFRECSKVAAVAVMRLSLSLSLSLAAGDADADDVCAFDYAVVLCPSQSPGL